MSIRVDELKSQAQIKMYKEEIEMYKEELKSIPWYTINKKRRKYRSDLKTGIKGVKKLMNELNK